MVSEHSQTTRSLLSFNLETKLQGIFLAIFQTFLKIEVKNRLNEWISFLKSFYPEVVNLKSKLPLKAAAKNFGITSFLSC